jgi:hypothetical protein
MDHRRTHPQQTAAAKAGISERSARRIDRDPTFDARPIERLGDVDRPDALRPSAAYAAFFSKSAFHWPRLASPFMRARWEKARWAAATFSVRPDHAFCGAACRARP